MSVARNMLQAAAGAGGDASYDISNLSFVGNTGVLQVTLGLGNMNQLFLKDDGTYIYIAENSGAETLLQVALSTPYDITSIASTATNTFSWPHDGGIFGFSINSTGSKMIVYSGKDGDRFYEYSFGTNWDISTLSQNNSQLDNTANDVYGLYIAPNGTDLFVTNIDTVGDVSSFTLASSYTLDRTFVTQDTPPGITGDLRGVWLNDDGTKWFYCERDGTLNESVIHQIELATPFDLSSRVLGSRIEGNLSLIGASGGGQTNLRNISGMCWSSDGQYLYVGDFNSGVIFQFSV